MLGEDRGKKNFLLLWGRGRKKKFWVKDFVLILRRDLLLLGEGQDIVS